MKLLIPAEILKVATIYACKDKIRYNINCLLFEDGKVLATNGHSLLVWRHGAMLYQERMERIHTSLEKTPEIRQNGKDPDFLMFFDKASFKFVKAADKKVLAFHYDTETHILSDGYGQSITLKHDKDVNFPEWRKALPDTTTLTPIVQPIGTSIIETFEEYAKARNGKGVHGFTVLTTGVANNSFFLMPNDFDDCFIIAMPIRAKQTLDNHLETISKVIGVKETIAT